MDELFAKLAVHAVSMVGRAAFGIAVNRAVRNAADYVQQKRTAKNTAAASPARALTASPADARRRSSASSMKSGVALLADLQAELAHKVSVLAPTIDMIHVLSARSRNAGVRAVLALSADLDAALKELAELPKDAPVEETIELLRELLVRVDEIVPFVTLCLSVNASTFALPPQFNAAQKSVIGSGPGAGALSSSVLLRASSRLNAASSAKVAEILSPGAKDTVAAFPCRVYKLFGSVLRDKGHDKWSWKLEMRAALVSLCLSSTLEAAEGKRVSSKRKRYAYTLRIAETFDKRYNDDGAVLDSDGVGPSILHYLLSDLRGICFAAAGDLLRISDCENPVLVLRFQDYVALELIEGPIFKRKKHKNTCVAKSVPHRSKGSVDDKSDNDETVSDADSDDLSTSDSDTETEFGENENENEVTAKKNKDRPDLEQKTQEVVRKSLKCGAFISAPHSLIELDYMLRLAIAEESVGCSHLEIPDELLLKYITADNPLSSPPPTSVKD